MKIENLRAPTIKEAGTATIGVAALFSAMSVLGIGIVTPWPARADLEGMQGQIDRQQKQIEKTLALTEQQACTTWQLLRDKYQHDRDEAQEEYTKTRSAVAMRARDEAAQKAAQMDAKLRQSPCV